MTDQAPPGPIESPPPGPAKKPWYKRWWAITLYVFIGLVILGNIIGEEEEPAASEQVETVEPEETESEEEPEPEKTKEPEPEKTTEKPSPAKTTEKPSPTKTKEADKTKEPEPKKTTEKPSPKKTEKPKPTKTASPEEQIENATDAENVVVDSESASSADFTIVLIHFDIQDMPTKKMIASVAQTDSLELLEAAQESDLEFDRVALQGHFDMTDQYGDLEDSIILNAGYDTDNTGHDPLR